MRPGEIDLKTFLKQHKQKSVVKDIKQEATYLTVKEYANHLRVSTTTIYQLLRANRIEGAVQLNRKWIIPVIKA